MTARSSEIFWKATAQDRQPPDKDERVPFCIRCGFLCPIWETSGSVEGADKTVTLIAGPGTPHEKTYVKSCGENGAVRFQLAPGYEELYLDRDCIQECSFGTTAR